jgi:hypothetical protein
VTFAQLACTAGVKPSQAGSAGTTGTGSAGTTGLGGTTGSAGTGSSGTTGTAGTGNTGGTTPSDAGACQQAEVMFVPKIPTAYLVVDRSGSMFHCLSDSQQVCPTQSDTSWSQLKTAIETVLTGLDAQVRFGFTTIFGTNPAGGGSCPLLTGTLADNVPPALNNAAAIKTKYDGLAWPNPNDASNTGKKFESPASEALDATTKALLADTTPGDKYIIFITDGQEDYCDDALAICASDSTVYRLQAAAAAGIKTIVFGLQTTQFNLPAGVLQAFANAGAGEMTLPPEDTGLDLFAFYDQCQGVAPWRADLTASGQTGARGVTLGKYSTTAGPTKPYQPNASDQTMLVTQLSTALAGVKSCTFDLSNVGGKAIKVSLDKLGKASVVIQGTTVPLDANNTNGWDMTSDTVLELFGPACDAWRDPNVTDIQFNFPCDIIIT